MYQAEMYRYEDFDMKAVDNWTNTPFVTIPESAPGTFSRSVRDFADTYLPTPTSSHGLQSGDVLYPGDSRMSVDGRFTFIYQLDGNLVLSANGSPLWASNTSGTSAGLAAMQGDGNLVVYDSNGVARWSSGTSGRYGAFLVVQSDGNVVIYQPPVAVWATGTNYY
jgi:hypothetical protein